MLDALTLDQMRVFAAVADAGSFRAGAQRLHRVQSAVSHAISNLEAQLCVPLFDRSAYKPTLTPAGEALLREVRTVLANVDRLRARARELQEGLELDISLSVDTLFPPDALSDALARMHHEYPTVDVRVEYASLGGTYDALLSGDCTMAIAALDFQHDRVARDYLLPVTTVAVVAPSHPLAKLSKRSSAAQLADIAQHVQIIVEDRSRLTRGRDFGVLSTRKWRVGDMYVKLSLLRAGLGWGSLPSWLVQSDLDAGQLVRVPAPALGPDGEVSYRAYVCHRTDQPLGPASRCFIEQLSKISTRHTPQRKRRSFPSRRRRD